MFAGKVEAAMYYVNSNCISACDGSTAAKGWPSLFDAQNATNVPIGSTVEVVSGSGPYYESLIPLNTQKNITWNFNNTEVREDVEVNQLVSNGTHKWNLSSNPSHVGEYYLTYATAQPVNLVRNSGMEVGNQSNWVTYSALSVNERSSAQVHSGSYSRHIIKIGSGGVQQLGITPKVGTTYKVSGWYYLVSGDIKVYFYGNQAYLTTLGSWQYFSYNIVATDSNTTIKIWSGEPAEYYIDDIKIEELDGSNNLVTTFNPWRAQFDKISDVPSGSTESVNSVVIDGVWSGSTTSSWPLNKWYWGDYDSLGYNTLYIKWTGGDPTGQSLQILAAIGGMVAQFNSGVTGHVINNIKLIGSNWNLINVSEAVTINKSEFKYANEEAIDLVSGGTSLSNFAVNNSKFIDCGHRGLVIEAGITANPINVFNDYFYGCHLEVLNSDANTVILNFKNNSQYNALAGSIQWQTTSTLNESNNQFHIDSASVHGGKKIGFYPSGSSNWIVTASSDIPASFDTTSACDSTHTQNCGTDPQVDGNGASVALSPLIDSGTASVLTSTTTDYLGHPLYGLPDIGAYEYQPPFTLGTSLVDPTGNIRIYGDKQYRYTSATSSTMHANFSVAPAETWTYAASTTRPEWLDISSIIWNTTGGRSKQWTASSTLAESPSGVHATSTIYTIGDLLPSTAYTFKLDDLASTTAITGYGSTVCASGVCTSNSSGVVSFTYIGGYSTHTFALIDITAPVITETTTISTPSTDTTPSYVFSTTEAGTLLYAGACTPSSTSISLGSNTVTFNTLSDGTYTNCKLSVIDSAGNDSATTTLSSFTVDTTAPTSSTSVSGATYSNIQSVSLSCSDPTSGCDKIYYTTNGSTPTTGSAVYANPITINSGYTSLKFFATDLAGNSNSVQTENYSIITGSVSIFSSPAQTQTVPAGDVKSPLPPLLKGENTNPPSPPGINPGQALYQGGKIATMEQMLSEAKLILQPANGVTQTAPTALANFITNGTPTTLILGSGERSGVVNSFTSAFGRAPQSETDWSDVIKIANGRWPSQTNQTTETNAEIAFRKIYHRAPNLEQANDNAAVTVISYGLRPANRNLNSEQAAIKSFMAIYGHIPKSAMAWDIVRAIAYSGAKR